MSSFLEFYNTLDLIESDLLTEDTRKELLQKVDPDFIHHAKYTKDLPIDSPTASLYDKTTLLKYKGKDEIDIWFKIRGATSEGHPWWSQRFVVLGLYDQLKDSKDGLVTLRSAVNENDILIACTCSSWKFWGYEWLATKAGVNHPRFHNSIAPNTNNPQHKGIMCKHLHLALDVLPFNTAKIYSDIKKLITTKPEPKKPIEIKIPEKGSKTAEKPQPKTPQKPGFKLLNKKPEEKEIEKPVEKAGQKPVEKLILKPGQKPNQATKIEPKTINKNEINKKEVK